MFILLIASTSVLLLIYTFMSKILIRKRDFIIISIVLIIFSCLVVSIVLKDIVYVVEGGAERIERIVDIYESKSKFEFFAVKTESGNQYWSTGNIDDTKRILASTSVHIYILPTSKFIWKIILQDLNGVNKVFSCNVINSSTIFILMVNIILLYVIAKKRFT